MKKRFKKPNNWSIIAVTMLVMLVCAYLALSTDAFIDVGVVDAMATHDLSMYDQQRMRRYSQNVLYGVFNKGEDGSVESTEDGIVPPDSDTGGGVYNPDASVPDGVLGNGTTGNQVDTICTSIPVYSDSSQQGGTFIDVRPSFASKGVTNYNNWAAYMYPAGSDSWSSNGNMKKVNGLSMNSHGNVVDANGRIVIAVGPGVMNPNGYKGGYVTGGEMRYGTNLDVVLEKGGQNYYLHCVVGDGKVHTYPSGIIQTGYYKTKDDRLGWVEPGHADSTWTETPYDNSKAQQYGNGIVEFCKIQDLELTNCKNYNIVGFITY